MSSLLPSRKVAALAVASSGLAVVLTGPFASVATAAPATVPTASATSSAPSDWFADPRSRAQRKGEVPVPKNPGEYRGKVRETRAVYRTHAGALAVPIHYAFGNTVAKGQAVTLDNIGRLFVPKSLVLWPMTPTARAPAAAAAAPRAESGSSRRQERPSPATWETSTSTEPPDDTFGPGNSPGPNVTGSRSGGHGRLRVKTVSAR